MIANVIWNTQKSTIGIASVPKNPSAAGSAGPTSFIQAKSKLPMTPPLPAAPKDRLKTTAHHSTARIPMAKKFCMSMPSTFFERTMPP